MKLSKFELFAILLQIKTFMLSAEVFNGKMTFPFTELTIKNKTFENLYLKLNCRNVYENVKECIEQCYLKERSGADCVALMKDKFIGNCKLCNPANQSEIMNNTQINENHVLYILKYKKKKPVMYLPLEGDNITYTTVKGEGINGTLIKKENTEIQTGKVNQGLHVNDRARMILQNTADTCIGNLALCPNGLSISLWINPARNVIMRVAHSDNQHSICIQVWDRTIEAWTYRSVESRVQSKSTVQLGKWTHVTVVYNPRVGLLIYIDGVLEAIKPIDQITLKSADGATDYAFGSAYNGQYYFEGTLDEIKIFYNKLYNTGILLRTNPEITYTSLADRR